MTSSIDMWRRTFHRSKKNQPLLDNDDNFNPMHLIAGSVDFPDHEAIHETNVKMFPVISPQSFGRLRKFCPICLDLLTTQTITKTACNHYVHRSCLLDRLAEHPSTPCPTCRAPLKPPPPPRVSLDRRGRRLSIDSSSSSRRSSIDTQP